MMLKIFSLVVICDNVGICVSCAVDIRDIVVAANSMLLHQSASAVYVHRFDLDNLVCPMV
jgi:hypothetical protein